MKSPGTRTRRQTGEDKAQGSGSCSWQTRKGRMTSRRRDRLLWGQHSDLFEARSSQCSPRRSSRRININKRPLPVPVDRSEDQSTPSSEPTTSDLKRKFSPDGIAGSASDQPEDETTETQDVMAIKKRKPSMRKGNAVDSHGEGGKDAASKTKDEHTTLSRNKEEREKERQKQKKRRQKRKKQVQTEEQRRMMEESARQIEAESSEPRRFLFGMPLASVRDLNGGSVCKHFRKRDLVLNHVLPVSLDLLSASESAKALYESVQGPIYFSISCKKAVDRLKKRLTGATVCSKLLVVNERHFEEVITPSISTGRRRPRLLNKKTLAAIEQVLEDSQPPHELESSQNAEDKIKCLFNPILKALGLDDTIITTGFSWKEKIGLRSSVDLGTHNYAPKSDVAIIKVLSKSEARILILFEAYSKLGQGPGTLDENRADRVRLLIQGSYISIRDAKPSVVFYLTQDKQMETILIFAEDGDQDKFGYYAEKQPFYNEVAWVDLVCQIINLV